MKWLDLFSGVGMYALGLEQAGHEVIGFCEKEEFCKKVLKKHWPTKPISSCVKLFLRALMASESLRAGRVKMLPLQPPIRPQALMVNEQDFGQSSLEPFAWYDQTSRCWRTWQCCLIEGLEKYSETWPKSGLIRNGIAYAQKPLACPMIEKDFISLPTPLASDYKGTSRKRYRGSPDFRSGRTVEVLRTCPEDPTYTHPQFAEAMMGLPKDFTLLETETLHASSEKLPKICPEDCDNHNG
jgi:hypothetical protein